MNDGFEGTALFYRVNKVSRDLLAQMVLQAQWYVQTIKFCAFLKWVNVFYMNSFSLLFFLCLSKGPPGLPGLKGDSGPKGEKVRMAHTNSLHDLMPVSGCGTKNVFVEGSCSWQGKAEECHQPHVLSLILWKRWT